MRHLTPPLVLFAAFQIVGVTAAWFVFVAEKEWEIVQQFLGHIGPATFLVAMGAAAIFLRNDLRRLIRLEAWLAVAAGAAYVLADTFIMHPPFGVFSGPGQAEQEHVAIMSLVFMLGVSALVMMRKQRQTISVAPHFIIGIAVAAIVFANHHQHTEAGSIAHYATILFLGVAALLRLLEKYTEYAIAMIVTGYVFFCSQMGFAYFIDGGDYSAGAWIALWAMLGFASATGFIAMSPADPVPAE